ncbi:MAG TPA: class I SAM-dependent methyltransferase [Phycisphaerae bacterium]|nr:class I SAM-dependent methyltransferase [Phycisphaerae bacterium]
MSTAGINKTMDRDDLHRPECGAVLAELFGLMRRMRRCGAKYSSWYGQTGAWPSAWEHINRGPDYQPWPDNPDELAVPWFLLWETAWLTANMPMRPGSRVLDMGGAGSLFSSYLASRGHDVYAIDLDEGLCRLADETAARMQWRLTARRMDMTALDFPDAYFDHVFSVCVFEHLPVSGRVACNRQVARVLKPGGTAAYTFDYDNPQSFGRLDTPEDVRRQLIEPSGLALRGGGAFWDGGRRYLLAPQCFGFGRFTALMARIHAWLRGSVERRRALTGATSYTIGAVFLEKTGRGA